MTGNVAQVFVTDEEWMAALRACRAALSADGRLVFEVRDPAKEAWKGWNREQSYQAIEAPGIGMVESWVELVHVQLPLVSFRHIFVFRKDGRVITSESTLRFRTRSEIDRKSTRLNSSHANISYAVFCLKKKKQKITTTTNQSTRL